MNIENWLNKPAKWWQFWFPLSGAIGGIIMGMVAAVLFIAVPTLFLMKSIT